MMLPIYHALDIGAFLSPSVGGLFSSLEDHSSPTRPAMLVDLQFRRQFVYFHFCALVNVYLLSSGYTLPCPYVQTCSCLHTTMLLSPQRAHVILASKGTQLRSYDYVLFGVLVCFRHRRALTVHLCHLRSEHSGNVRIKHNPHYHVWRFIDKYLTNYSIYCSQAFQ